MTKATRLTVAALTFFGLAFPAGAASAADEAGVIVAATRVVELMAANPDSGVPMDLIRQSEGIILVPNMLNASFVFGAKYGRGVFLVRDGKGKWGNPVLITIAGGSFGLQAGGQATEILMLIRKRETVNRLLVGKGKVTLGVDAGVAAGPAGSNVGAETDLEFRAEILSYAKSRGLFAGASLGGAGIRADRHANGLYYDNFAASAAQIIEGDMVSVPIEAAKLKAVLSAVTDPPPAAGDPDDPEAKAPGDKKLSRTSRTRRADDPEAMPTGRASTRRRRPVDDEADAPPRQARASTRTRPPAGDDEPDADAPPPKSRRKPTPTPSSEPAPKNFPDDPAPR